MQSTLNNIDKASLIDHYEFLPGNGCAVFKDIAGIEKKIQASSNISPVGGLANVFQGSQAQITFNLPIGTANSVDVCESMVLELTLTNNDAGVAADTLAGQFLLNYIQVLCGNDLENSYAEHQFIRELYEAENDNILLQEGSLRGYDYNYSATNSYQGNVSIAATESHKFYINLYTLINKTKLFLPAVNGQISINCYFSSTAVESGSASTDVSLTNTRLIMNGYRYREDIRQKKIQLFKSKKHVYSYLNPRFELLSSVTVSSAAVATLQISALSDAKLPLCYLLVRAANATQEARYTFDRVGTLDFRSNGLSVFGTTLNYQEFTQMCIDNCVRTSVPNSNLKVLPIPFTTNVYETLKDNKIRGYLESSPNIQLQFQMDSVSGNRDLMFVAFQHVAVIVDNGNLRVDYL